MIPASEPGRLVRRLDRYELIAQLAKGGMGRVYLARLQGFAGFERLLAIKLLHPHLAEEPQFVSMLFDEARLAAKLHHPNAVAITDVCHTDAGHYLVMEYVDGFTLHKVLSNKKLKPTERIRLGLRILMDAAAGLDAAHNLKEHDGTPIGLVHRDVSPQNIMVGVNGVGRITDFGIAKAAARITSSRPGTIKGKMRYMAPEQAMGKVVDCRADIFALGIIIWEILTGESLFFDPEGDAATLVKVVHGEIPTPRSKCPLVTPQLEHICLKALERDVGKRYQTVRELIDVLDTAARKSGLLASTHEVADRVNELFAEKIASRSKAIQRHIEAIEATSAIHSSDVFSVPELVRPSDPEFVPSTNAEIHILTGEEVSAARRRPRKGRKLPVFGAVAVLTALVLLGVGPRLFEDDAATETTNETPTTTTTTEADMETEPAAETETASSMTAEAETDTDMGTQDPPPAEPTAPAEVTVETEPRERPTKRPPSRARPQMTTRMMATTHEASPRDEGPPALEVEDNPYLRR